MSRSHLAAAGAVGAAIALTLAACGGGGQTQSSGDLSSKTGKPLVVWLMQDTLTPASQKAIVGQFEKQTGSKIKIEIQQWDNINTKLTTALATNTPPDVVEIGNTDVPLFAATGALANVTSEKPKLDGGSKFITSLEGPATVNGQLFAAPFYGGARAVVYNKTTWAKAGVSSPPKTFAEMESDLGKVAAHNKTADFSPIYVSGTYWYGGFSFVTDAGGTVATDSNGKWTSGLTSAAAVKGLQEFKDFQNKYSTVASRTAPLDTPDPNAIFGTGKTATLLGNANSLTTIVTTYPKLKGHVGSFVLPSPNHPGQAAPTFVGGSDLGIAAKSQNKALAIKFIEMIDSQSVQLKQLTTADGHTPVTDKLLQQAAANADPSIQAFFQAASKSYSTPASPGWATIETDQTVLSYFSQVAAGTSTPQQSASKFASHLAEALNSNK